MLGVLYYLGVTHVDDVQRSLGCLSQRASDGNALIHFDRYGLLGHPAVLMFEDF
jgi:hypothetical protein